MPHNRRRFFRLLVLLLLALALLLAGPVLAQDTVPSDDEVNAIAKQLYCPVCENIPLDVCPTQACIQWRQTIREKLAEGWGEDQIKDYFVQQYGDRVLAEPPPRGLNWLVYLIPPAALLAGAFVLYRAFKAWQAPPPSPVHPSPGMDDEYIQRLERELQDR